MGSLEDKLGKGGKGDIGASTEEYSSGEILFFLLPGAQLISFLNFAILIIWS